MKNYLRRIYCLFRGEPGQIVLDQIRTDDKIRLSKKVGKIEEATSKNVCTILQVMFQYVSTG